MFEILDFIRKLVTDILFLNWLNKRKDAKITKDEVVHELASQFAVVGIVMTILGGIAYLVLKAFLSHS